MGDYNGALREYNIIRQRMNRSGDYFTVVFCGVFSSGKSSLINQLLNYEQFKLPTGINPVTKLITRIRYGEQLRFSCVINSAEIQITEKDFVDMVKGNNIPAGIEEINILIPSLLLKNRVEFIDTPGFQDEMGGELERMSRRAVNDADLAIFCTNALQLGERFEKEFIAELEQTVGSFLMVVNRMDNLHEEELQPVRQKAEFLMKGKGGRLISQTLGTNVFFSSANGKFINLGGFDSAIALLLENEELKNAVMADTKHVNVHQRISRLKEQAEWELEGLHYTLASLQAGHQTELSRLEIANSIREMNAGAKKRSMFSKYMSELDTHTENAAAKITGLYRTGQSDGFEESVIYILKTEYYPVARQLDDLVSGGCPTVDSFNRAIHRLSVPAPASQKVKARGVVKRLQNDLQAAKKYGASAVTDHSKRDDGFDTVYNEYHLPAINAVKKILLPELQNILNEKMNDYRSQLSSNIAAKSGYESRISSAEAQIEKWMNLIRSLGELE